jgi:hypothetical protein
MIVAKHFDQFAKLRKLMIFAIPVLTGCSVGAQTVATDVQVVEKPVPVACRIDWPPAPRAHVALVQLTGDPKKDLVLIERAKEAELEERIAYEGKLEAAARACVADPPAAQK